MAEYDDRFSAFIPPHESELNCNICLGLLYDPMMSPCGHVFCKNCFEKWLDDHDTCPQCSEKVSLSSLEKASPEVANQIQSLEVQCTNRSSGCEEVCTLERYEVHRDVCPYRMTQCPSVFCEEDVLLQDLDKHKAECMYSIVGCPKCEVLLFRSKLTKHDCQGEVNQWLESVERSMIEIRDENEGPQEMSNERSQLLESAAETLKLVEELRRQIRGWKEVTSNKIELLVELFRLNEY